MKNKLIKHIKENVVGYVFGMYSLAFLSLPVIDYVNQGNRTGEWNITNQSSECFKNTIAMIASPEILFVKQLGDKLKDTANYYKAWESGLPHLKDDTCVYFVDSWGNHRLPRDKKDYVIGNLDKDKNGHLDFKEKSKLYKLMEIEGLDNYYIIPSKYWEIAYNKIKSQENNKIDSVH